MANSPAHGRRKIPPTDRRITGEIERLLPQPSQSRLSVEAAGDVADQHAEQEVDKDDKRRGRGRRIERDPRDEPLVDEDGDGSGDLDGLRRPERPARRSRSRARPAQKARSAAPATNCRGP